MMQKKSGGMTRPSRCLDDRRSKKWFKIAIVRLWFTGKLVPLNALSFLRVGTVRSVEARRGEKKTSRSTVVSFFRGLMRHGQSQ